MPEPRIAGKVSMQQLYEVLAKIRRLGAHPDTNTCMDDESRKQVAGRATCGRGARGIRSGLPSVAATDSQVLLSTARPGCVNAAATSLVKARRGVSSEEDKRSRVLPWRLGAGECART